MNASLEYGRQYVFGVEMCILAVLEAAMTHSWRSAWIRIDAVGLLG